MKKLLLGLLVLSMLLATLAACGKKPADSTVPSGDATDSATDSTGTSEAEKPYELPVRKYDGRKFTILMPPGKIWQLEEHQVNPDALNSAIFSRNSELEFAYDVDITPMYKGNNALEFNQTVHTELNAQTGAYDVCYYPLEYGMIGYISQSRYFYNLLEANYLDLECDWWLQDWNDILTMNNKLFGICGYGVVEAMSGAVETYFNKTIYNELYSESDYSELYQTVDAGKWTIEKMTEMAMTAKRDADGDGTMNPDKDRYGIVSNGIAYALLYSMNSEYIIPDETEGYVLNFKGEHNVDVFQKLFRVCNSDYYLHMTEWLAPNQVFGDGRALFQISAFDQAYRIMQTGVDYGILPLPKYDEAQTRYYTVNNAKGCFAIFTTCDDFDYSSMLLNAWNYYSYNIIRPQYKDSFYKYQVGKESEDSRMIDLVFKSMSPEFAHAYGTSFGNVAGKIYSLILNKDTGYSTLYSSNKDTWQSQLDIILGKKAAAPSPFDD